MKIDAQVKKIENLHEYFFAVPDYQREYVWEADKQVAQFLADIQNEFDERLESLKQSNYFIGSIIIVKKGTEYEVIDGQQRLTTIIIALCAMRNYLEKLEIDDDNIKQLKNRIFDEIKKLLYEYNLSEEKNKPRLTLQYEESKDYLSYLIETKNYIGEETRSIKRMHGAYDTIFDFVTKIGEEDKKIAIRFIKYFLVNIEIVIIQPENLGSALKIFETINQRGVGLNAMDLLKNLIFQKSKSDEFDKIKEIWLKLTKYLEKCGEGDKPLRFLRYFLMARYYEGIIREDNIYTWIISPSGKEKIKYENNALEFAKELLINAERYSKYVNATNNEDKNFPYLTKIGLLGKKTFRQHLILLLALKDNLLQEGLKLLSENIEVLIFYYFINNEQTKIFEAKFSTWAKELRNINDTDGLKNFIKNNIETELHKQESKFNERFLIINQKDLLPIYRTKYVLGRIEDYIREEGRYIRHNLSHYQELQLEHILPQKPDGKDPDLNESEYNTYLYRFGNLSLVESTINQALNKANKVDTDEWFKIKKSEYKKSDIFLTSSIAELNKVGTNTSINTALEKHLQPYDKWNKQSIIDRQKMLFNIVKEIWKINY